MPLAPSAERSSPMAPNRRSYPRTFRRSARPGDRLGRSSKARENGRSEGQTWGLCAEAGAATTDPRQSKSSLWSFAGCR
jgi:hypothetical protein